MFGKQKPNRSAEGGVLGSVSTVWDPSEYIALDKSEWVEEESRLVQAALACINELVQLQGYLDGLLAEAEEKHGASQYRIDTPEFAVKMMTLLLGSHTGSNEVAADVAEKLVADRTWDAEDEDDIEDEDDLGAFAEPEDTPLDLMKRFLDNNMR